MERMWRHRTLVGRAALIGVMVGAGVIAPSVAIAADDDPGLAAPRTTPEERHREGEYGGATPGVVHPYSDEDQKKRFRRPAPRRKDALYWIGFQVEADGQSRLFLQMTRDAEYTQAVVGDQLVVTVVGVRPLAKNTLRRMDVRYFDTALLEVKSTRVKTQRARKGRPAQKAGIKLQITFKNPADAREASAGLQKEKDEFYYLYLDFGSATPVPPAAEPPGGAGGAG